MADEKKMVDFPEYDPDRRVPFPPPDGAKTPFGTPNQRKPEEKPAKKPYYESYDPDPPAPDPSQTGAGPDIRDPDTKLPEDADLSRLSPDVDHKV